MKITLNIVYDVPDYGLIIDENGYYYRLPFTDVKGRKWAIKRLFSVWHKNYSAIRIRQRLISEKVVNRKRMPNKRTETFNINKPIKGIVITNK